MAQQPFRTCFVAAAALALVIDGCGRSVQSPPVVTTFWSEMVTWSANDMLGLSGIFEHGDPVTGIERAVIYVAESVVAAMKE